MSTGRERVPQESKVGLNQLFHETMVVGLHMRNELQSAPEPLQQFNSPFKVLHPFRWCLPDLRVLE